MWNKTKFFWVIVFLSFPLYISASYSDNHHTLTIDIHGAKVGALKIAVIPFGWDNADTLPPIDMASIVNADLRRSGDFLPMVEAQMPTKPVNIAEVDFKVWQQLGINNIVIGRMKAATTGKYEIQFQLFNTYTKEQLTGFSIPASTRQLRKTAHIVSDIVYEKLIGKKGAFATQVAYVTVIPKDNQPQYALRVADSDGYNPQTMAISKEPILSPSWSPDGNRIAYVSFERRGPAIYIQEKATGKRIRIPSMKGVNGAPAWAPDGKKLAITMSDGENADIYIYDLDKQESRRLTRHYAIDTEPTWSPDGRFIVFTSDRGGKPQLYRSSSLGGKIQRITFDGDYNARASYSPDGKSIAMVRGIDGKYQIALLELSNGSLRVLTTGNLDESPSFSPNGSMIIYATEDKGRGVLAAVSVDGNVHQRLKLQEGDVREPAWSPY